MNRQWVLASRPVGAPSLKNFRLNEAAIAPPQRDEVLINTLFLSVDPHIRARMRNVKSYAPPYDINHVIESGAVGQVVQSSSPHFKSGDFVLGKWGWQEQPTVSAATLSTLSAQPEKLSLALGALGMPGLTAYFALLDIGQPKPGETVLVSGAAGAVGSLVGQIAKMKGCRVVGVAGSDEKCAVLKNELGFDGALNYKTTRNLRSELRDLCPNGVDVYFDNVGGPISDAAITLINQRARIVICGQIALYNREKTEEGPRNWLYLLVYRARMEGFLVMDYAHRYPEGLAALNRWIDQGLLKTRETVVEGFENTPRAFLGLFSGDNLGKQIVRVAR